MDVVHLAWYIVNNFSELSPEGITLFKLQKLLYFIKAWSLVADVEIADMAFYKEDFGPLNPDIEDAFKTFAAEAITPDATKQIVLSPDKKKFLDFVVGNYIKHSAITLSALTAQDKAWQETPLHEKISEEAIKGFYNSFSFANNFPVESSKPFYPVATDMHFAFVLDIVDNEQTGLQPFASYDEFLAMEEQSEKLFIEQLKNKFGL
ncbi:MAG: DUF4065 domain-containing protein [Ignavibacteriales bacterium]|nr:DUF4065 domain-containing protein [Ignavibacteriales bacterium]